MAEQLEHANADIQDAVSMKTIRHLAEKYGFHFKKSLGQNFLLDRHVLQKIVKAADLNGEKGALEIGPGLGALTQSLAQHAGKVVAVEIDARLIPMLEETLRPFTNVCVIEGDVLKLDLHEICREHFSSVSKVSLVANLPYYVTTPILMKILEERLELENIVVMVQKEVADRFTAKPGGKDYSSLSIAVQYFCTAETIAFVPRNVFIPRPNVDSVVLRLRPRTKKPVDVADESFFFSVVRASFAQRRKTLLNNLRDHFLPMLDKEQWSRLLRLCDIDPSRRGETLSMEEFARLANLLYEQFGSGLSGRL